MREPSQTDFEVKVEGVGTFVFAKRTFRDHMKIEVEFARIIDGVEPTEFLRIVGNWLATLRVLTVVAPSGWDLDDMDPLDQETYANLMKVHRALSDKEGEFRGWKREAKQESGEAVGDDATVLVSPEVQPAAE